MEFPNNHLNLSEEIKFLDIIFKYFEKVLGGLIMDINTRRLRCIIGWLAILLPWIIVAVIGFFPASISITFYEFLTASPIFMIILGSASILLICYQGYEKKDDILNTIAAICGLGVCLFPTAHNLYPIVTIFQISSSISTVLHLIFAVAFFAILAINSLFLFTKSSLPKDQLPKKKKIRNIIFRVCGVGMVASFVLLLFPIPCVVWLVETIALLFFGISWLTKANCYSWLAADTKESK